MDPFSHFLLGYLLGFGLWGPNSLQYVVAAAVAGGLPDLDVLLYPLSRRFPLLRHRGISHSILGVTVLAVVGTFVVPLGLAAVFGAAFAAGSPWAYFVSLEVGGLSHVLLDAMDHWSVPIFAPFHSHEYSFDADRIANFGGMVFTVVAYGAMLYERGRTPLWGWVLTAWLLLAAVGIYFIVRLGARWAVERPRRRGGFSSVIPQSNPLRFRLYHEESLPGGRTRLRVADVSLLDRRSVSERTLEFESPTGSTPACATPLQAVALSLAPAENASWWLKETNRFAVAHPSEGGFDVFWHSLEMVAWGRSAGAMAHVDGRTGQVTVRSAWRNVDRLLRAGWATPSSSTT